MFLSPVPDPCHVVLGLRIAGGEMRAAVVVLACALGLAACGGPRQADPQLSAATSAARDCILAEAERVAPKPVDLETAAQATVAGCAQAIAADRAALMAKYPGYEDVARAAYAEKEAGYLTLARRTIALARTK